MEPVYLDYNATTPLDSRVFETMREWYTGPAANAGSRTHEYGNRAKQAVDAARQQVADVVGIQPEEVIFTSGATESNNLAILGLREWGEKSGRRHVISTAIEHKAVLEPLEQLRKAGFDVDLAPVTPSGYVEPSTIRGLLREDTLLVSVMHANNETGVIQPLAEIAACLEGSGVFFHTDAAQTFGKEVEELRNLPCHLVSISSHKIYGPQGIGALVVRRSGTKRVPLRPLLHGGGQERGLRPGTLPVPLVVGLGKAAELALHEHARRSEAASRIRQRILGELMEIDHRVNGDGARCQAHVLNVSFPGVDSEALMLATRERMAVSNGSACTTASYEGSHVLRAMNLSEDQIDAAVRISWGPGTTIEDIALLFTTIDAFVNSNIPHPIPQIWY